ncbi:MAG: putative outer membrane lipoprotein [Chlorobi bacterium OLB6]|nr:MAG: putative outer membrane lipoprotein [Chlorobi bacterium OLB6]MBW7854298.1 hypothetical protein [Candidatus Kapabacteria bacterium]MCL4276783.1 hypothetical protein [Ignavibacteria bacterium]NOG67730.1 hypothetical protein [Chlorobiota bacterium]QOJ25604.1 MAG: hypothetical protein HRU79_02655 [Ignavibacteria bacterium]
MRFLYTIALSCCVCILQAQEPAETFAVRVQGGLLYSLHQADFSYNSTIVDCGQFTSGTGANPVIQAIVEFPLSPALSLGAGIGYTTRSGTLSRTNTYPVRDGQTGNEGLLETHLALDAVLPYVELQPDVRWTLSGSNRQRSFGLIAGPRIALPLPASFTQHETIVAPEGGVFLVNGERLQRRIIAEGTLTSISPVLVGISIGAESFFPISKTLSLVPVVSADYFFSDVVTDASWKVFAIRAEVGLRFSMQPSPPPPPPPVIPPPPPPAVRFTPVTIAIGEPEFTGKVVVGTQLQATTPIVNAVFFDSAQTVVPPDYHKFDDGTVIPHDPIKAHNWVLVRIARIIDRNPSASIILEGAGGAQGSSERGRQRAESVKAVLTALGVNASRIATRSSDIPRIPSNADFPEGRAENNRVDVIVNDAPLQEWVTSQRFAAIKGFLTIPVTRMGGDPKQYKSEKIAVALVDSGHEMATANLDSSGTVQFPFEKYVTSVTDTVRYSVTAHSTGAAAERQCSILVGYVTSENVDLQTGSFEAVLRFDYNSSELTADVKQLLIQLTQSLPIGSTIEIVGSADVLGTAERNKQLSALRAKNTEEFITGIAGNKLHVTSGSMPGQFSDATPQGRFLNRSIRVRAITQPKP